MDNTPQGDQLNTPEGARPGDTITPGAVAPFTSTEPAAASPSLPAVPVSPTAAPAPVAVAPAAATTEPIYAGQAGNDQSSNNISWVAAEFVAHEKSPAWYGVLAVIVLLVAAIIFLITKDKISTSVVIVAGIALGGYGARKPQKRRYALDEQGLSIGEKYYPFDSFRSFAPVEGSPVPSITFFPLRRFSPMTTIYYDAQDEDTIINHLAERLPISENGSDVVDKFMHRIRF